ncbi:MAG: hypothetical protein K5756_00620 [Clostridiales bacterium]|nr:hypothetical protein [Clostridiales bacterium]
MIALYIILSIIAFIIVLFSIKITLVMDYDESFVCKVKWLFVKISLYPKPPKKKKKPKKEKNKKKEKPEDEEKKPEKKEEKGENPIKVFYKNQGFSGVIELIQRTLAILKKLTKGIARAFKFEKLYLRLGVGGSDAEKTARDYGKVCAFVFPAMGYICSNMRVNKYALDVHPDFVTGKRTAEFHVELSVVPIRLTNAIVAAGLRFVFKVLLKLLLANNKGNNTDQNKKEKSSKKENVR